MDPNTNQPQRPQPGQIANGQPFTPPRPQPDWQQGLGTAQPQGQQTPGTGELPPPAPSPASVNAQPTPQWTPPTPPAQPPAPQQPAMTPPTPSMGAGMPSSGNGGIKRILAIVGVVVFLIAIGVGVYWFASRTNSNASNTGSAELAAAENVTLLPPDTIDGFQSRQTGTANIKDYVATDNSCELIVGTTTAAQLPGADLDTILRPQIDQLKKAGATVTGPNSGSALVLTNTEDSKKTYDLPTLEYQFSQDKKHAVVHYSAVILKNGDRVVVNRTCINQDGEVDINKMTSLNEKAKAIQVMVEQKQ